jgi:hypothetical protein
VLMAFPPGTFSHVPSKVWQYAETRDEEVVFQITGFGPTGIDYLNAADDPRKPLRVHFLAPDCGGTAILRRPSPSMRFDGGDPHSAAACI